MKRSIHAVAVCALVYLMMQPWVVSAQEPPAHRVVIVNWSVAHLPMIEVGLSVTDDQDRPRRDLRPHEVQVQVDGQPITTTLTLKPQNRGLALAVVADFSGAMNDQSAPGQPRVGSMVEQIKRLTARLSRESPVSLVSFADKTEVALDWSTDAAGMRATLDALASKPLPQASAEAPYALTAAIKLGLAQFAQADPPLQDLPRALVVYATGVPTVSVDSAAIMHDLDALGANKPTITFVGLGASAAGQFISQQGNPESLSIAAQSLPNATFFPFFATDAHEVQLLRNRLDSRYKAVVDAEQLYTLAFNAGGLSVGAHSLDVSVRGATATTTMRISAVPPTITLIEPAPVAGGRTQLRSAVVYAQRPIQRVQYFLNDRLVATATNGPDFAADLDTSLLVSPEQGSERGAATSRQEILSAIATDIDGQQAPSINRITLQIPPPAGGTPSLLLLVGVGSVLGVLLLAVLAAFFIISQRQQRSSLAVQRLATPSRKQELESALDTPTLFLHAINEPYIEQTLAPIVTTPHISVVEGAERKTYALHYGQQATIGRNPSHPIYIASSCATRSHAQVTPVEGGVQLIDLGSTNGTFVGVHKRRLAPHTPELLRVGEMFWISPSIKMVVEP